MDRETQTKVLFLATLLGTGLLYLITAAEGYPPSPSTHWALAWSGVLPPLPHVPHPVWGYFVQVFAGHYIALSVVAASLSAGLLSAVVTRHAGWRLGAAVGLSFGFSPLVWNHAVTGGRFVSVLAAGAIALWLLDTWVLTLIRKYKSDALLSHGGQTGRRAWWWRVAAWGVLGASVVFAAVSLTYHDYALGEDATEYARGVLEGAEGKWVVLSGLADDQFYAEVRDAKRRVELLSLRTDDLYRTQLVSRVRAAFPAEGELVVAAEIGPRAFMDAARRAHPDLFVMADMDHAREKIEAAVAKARESGRRDVQDPLRQRPSLESLVEWNNQMLKAMDRGDKAVAGKLARAILSNPEWRTFIPANVVLGTITGDEGDLETSERCFRSVVAASTNELPAVVCNDFAETLRRLKKLDEAEAYARKAVAKGGPGEWASRLTLLQVLDDAKKDGEEIRALAAETMKVAPKEAQARLRDYLQRHSKRK